MDHRVTLLQEFYGGLPQDRAKVETYGHGFDFLEALLGGDGLTLDYGELTLTALLHKYKLRHITAPRMQQLLLAHVEKQCNVCLYFDSAANNVFCLNLDNNHKTGNTGPMPAMECAVRVLREHLSGLGCEPLVVASGRGYHVWGRLAARVDNDRLHDFMFHAAVRAMATLHQDGYDHRVIKFNVYPNRRIRDVVSLRLFGTNHAKNKVFSRVLTPNGLLDEDASWSDFERHLRNHTIPLERFKVAFAALESAAAEELPKNLALMRS